MAYDLNPDEVLSYGNRRRAALSSWGNQTAQIDLASKNADQGYSQRVAGATRSWNQGRSRLPGSFIRRNLMNSGLYGRGLQDFNTARNESFGQLAQDFYNQKAQYGMQRNAIDQQYYSQMMDIDEQERFRRAQKAAELQGIA